MNENQKRVGKFVDTTIPEDLKSRAEIYRVALDAARMIKDLATEGVMNPYEMAFELARVRKMLGFDADKHGRVMMETNLKLTDIAIFKQFADNPNVEGTSQC